MSGAEHIVAAGPNSTGLLARLGWNHRGFRARSQGAAVVALCLVLLVPFVLDQLMFQHAMRTRFPDLAGWLQNAKTLVSAPDQPFYERYGAFYVYPPFFLTLLWPLTKLPVALAAAIFQTVKWIAIVVSARAAWRLCAPPGEDVPPIVALGSLALTWRFIGNDLGVGNVNTLLLLAIVGGCWLLTRGWHVAAGVAVAAAVSVKVTPALLLVYFAYKGWWRVLVGAAVGMALFLVVWPAACLGWENNWQLLGGWYHAIVAGFVERGAVRSEHTNQALVGILNRLFGPHPTFVPDAHWTIVNLSESARSVVRFGVAGLTLLGLAWVCRGRLRPARRPLAFAAEVSLVLIAMLLLSGLSWKAHFVTMLLPYASVLAWLADGRLAAGRRRVVGGLLAASFVLCTMTGDILTPTGADYAEALGLIMLGSLLAGAAVWLVRERCRQAEPPGADAAAAC